MLWTWPRRQGLKAKNHGGLTGDLRKWCTIFSVQAFTDNDGNIDYYKIILWQWTNVAVKFIMYSLPHSTHPTSPILPSLSSPLLPPPPFFHSPPPTHPPKHTPGPEVLLTLATSLNHAPLSLAHIPRFALLTYTLLVCTKPWLVHMKEDLHGSH